MQRRQGAYDCFLTSVIDGYPIQAFDVMPDGRRFLVKFGSTEADSPPIEIIFGWRELAKQAEE